MKPLRSRDGLTSKALRLKLSTVLSLGAVSCSGATLVPELVPQHMTRVIQTESYTQYIDFCNPTPPAHEADLALRVMVLQALFGITVPDDPPLPRFDRLGSLEEKWNTKVFDIKGWLTVSITPYPYDQDMFVIEGRGRHVVFDRLDGQVVSKADFSLLDDGPHTIQELLAGSVTVRIRERNVLYDGSLAPNHPGTREREVFALIHVRQVGEDVFVIDYDRPHFIGMQNRLLGLPTQIFRIGHILFDPPASGQRILDLRGRHLPWIRDYSKLLSDTGHRPMRESHARYTWIPLPPGCGKP